MDIVYTIPQILALSGGIRYAPGLSEQISNLLNEPDPVKFQKASQEVSKTIHGYSGVNTISEFSESAQYSSSFFQNVPIFLPLVLESIESTSNDLLLESAIVELSRTKNIISTQVQGRDTSVDEFINNGEHQITVSGFLASKEGGYPQSKYTELRKFLDYKQPIQVVHKVLNITSIYEIVILDENIPRTQFTNIQPYSFTAKKSEPIELIIE